MMGSFGAEDRKEGEAAAQRAFLQRDKHRATTSSEPITLHHFAPGGGGRNGKPVLRIMVVLGESSLFGMLSMDVGVDNFMMPVAFHSADSIFDQSIAALFCQMQKEISIASLSFNSESDAKKPGVQGLLRLYGKHLALGRAVEFKMDFEHLGRYTTTVNAETKAKESLEKRTAALRETLRRFAIESEQIGFRAYFGLEVVVDWTSVKDMVAAVGLAKGIQDLRRVDDCHRAARCQTKVREGEFFEYAEKINEETAGMEGVGNSFLGGEDAPRSDVRLQAEWSMRRHEFVGEGKLAKYLLFLKGKFKGPLGRQLATELAKRLDVFKDEPDMNVYMKVLRKVRLPIVGFRGVGHLVHEMDQRALADSLKKGLGAFSLAGTSLRKRPGAFLQEETPGTHIVAAHEGTQPGLTEVFDDAVEGTDVATLDLFVPTVAPAAAPAAAQPRFTFMYMDDMDPVVGADVATR